MPRASRQSNVECATGMTVTRSAPSSRSWHERDDVAERNFLICDELWVHAMPVEQSAAAPAGNQPGGRSVR